MVYENKVYSCTEMQRQNILTDDYELMSGPGEVTATLTLKAAARNGMVRLFFTFSDGRKIITPVFWWQRSKGFKQRIVGPQFSLSGSTLKPREIL